VLTKRIAKAPQIRSAEVLQMPARHGGCENVATGRESVGALQGQDGRRLLFSRLTGGSIRRVLRSQLGNRWGSHRGLGMVAVTLLLYDLSRPVNRGASLCSPRPSISWDSPLKALRWNPRGVDTPVGFDGLSCLLSGYLILRSTFLPRILGC
jgi:hypothetical protein